MTLSKKYVEQLKKQMDLKFALTLKFMNSSEILEKTIQCSPDEIKNLSETELQKIILTVENAIAFADVLAKEICPITAPMEDASVNRDETKMENQK